MTAVKNASSVRVILMGQQNGECFYCKRRMLIDPIDKANLGLMCTIDHVVPRSKGGSNCRDNLVAACHQCNTARGSLPHDIFARYVRRFGPPSQVALGKTRRRIMAAREKMRANGLDEYRINDIMRVKLEEAFRVRSSAWIEHQTSNLVVAGSTPAALTNTEQVAKR